MGLFFSEPDFRDRPEWGIFDHVFFDCCSLSVESGITGFNGRKTGLFKPVWLADLLVDQAYLLCARETDFGESRI
jgi:hypothetical protein